MNTTSTINNLFAAVLRNPDDNVLRLAFADAVEEENWYGNGSVVAEWIRVSVRVQAEGSGETNRMAELCIRERAPLPLLDDRPFPTTVLLGNPETLNTRHESYGWQVPDSEYVFEVVRWDRGWPVRVRCRAEDWVKWGDRITEGQPLSEIELTTRPRYWVQLEGRVGFEGDPKDWSWYTPSWYQAEDVIRSRWPKLRHVTLPPSTNVITNGAIPNPPPSFYSYLTRDTQLQRLQTMLDLGVHIPNPRIFITGAYS